jgi:lipopolysaccharide export system protein LptA
MKSVYSVLLILALALFCAGPALAQDWGEIRAAKLNLNVRDARSPKGNHVVTLTKGERVKCDFLKNGWVAIFNLDETVREEKKAIGYANVKYLALVDTPKAKPQPTEARKEPETPETTSPKAATPKEGPGEVKAQVADSEPPDPIKIGVDPSKMPVQISSDRMTYDETGKVVSFVGNVVAEHGELKLWAERLSAYFSSKSGKQFSVDSVDRIVAEGNVKAKKGKTEGECQKVTYFVDKQLLTMEGDPVLRDGPNSLTGGVINFNVRENRSEVIRDKDKRVKAIFMTPAKIKGQ